MKYLAILLLFVSTGLIAQHDFDALIKPRITCEDVQYNAYQLLPQYYYQEKYDSISFFLEYWENKCGPGEANFRAKTLLTIQRGTFRDQVLTPQDYRLLTNYKEFIEWKHKVDSTYDNPLEFYHSTFEDAGVAFRFDSFTASWAEKIYQEFNGEMTCDESAILSLYREMPDEFTRIVQSCPNSALHHYMQEEAEAERNALYGNMALINGIWIPNGDASVLGVHPTLGILFGLQKRRWLFDLTLMFRYVKARNTYQVMFDDQLYNTDHFFGGYVGLDVNYQFANIGKHRVYALSGIAYDGFDSLNDEDDDDFTKSINSLNLNLGVGFKWMVSDNLYIGTEWRYNFVDYDNPGGTDLTGNTQSIRILIGGLSKKQDRRYWY